MRRALFVLLALLALALPAQAQVDPTGSISTAGSDCSTATNCVGWNTENLVSFGVYVNVATSGTFVYEVSQDATSTATGTWVAIDDAAGDANATADGAYYFANTGYRWFRIRASAISGTATVIFARGLSGGTSGAR